MSGSANAPLPQRSDAASKLGADGKQRADGVAVDSLARDGQRQTDRHDAATGVSAASARAATAPLVRGFLAFYFRAPAKAFISPRLDYMGYARAINPRVQANEAWSLHLTTPGILAHAVRTHGWPFIPRQVLAPLLANVGVGAVLYTSYLQTLNALHGSSYQAMQRVYPPPSILYTFTAGFVAGSIQSMLAAPLDALQVRFNSNQLLDGKYPDMWRYAYHKLHEIGVRGVLAGLSLSLAKDSFGFAAFFSTFEYVKAQAFYGFVTRYYGNLGQAQIEGARLRPGSEMDSRRPTIKPHFAVEPAFLLLAGCSATVAQQLVQYPLSLLQEAHYERLESLDLQAQMRPSASATLRIYRDAYKQTLRQSALLAKVYGGWMRWSYRGFLGSTLRQVPSTSAGLIIFELVRRMYADTSESVRIEKDGYDILLA